MGHPPEALRAFPPLSHGCAMRAGGRSPRCGAALARLPVPRPRRFQRPQVARCSLDHCDEPPPCAASRLPPALAWLRHARAGGRSPRCGAALARLPVPGSRRFRRPRVARCSLDHCDESISPKALRAFCRSRMAAPCGQGDAALAAGRPLLGCPRLGRASFRGRGWRVARWIAEMRHPPEPLRVFPPLSHGCAMRAGGRSPRCRAALARLPVPRPRRFRGLPVMQGAVND
jgi:hypothetical protein